MSDDSWPPSSSSFQEWQSKINYIQLTKTSRPNSQMNQENQKRMTAFAGKPSFTCKQPSLCKWPINLWKPDVPVYGRCLPYCSALWWIDRRHHFSAGPMPPKLKALATPTLTIFFIPQPHSPVSRLGLQWNLFPLANEVKGGPPAFNKSLCRHQSQTFPISKQAEAPVSDTHTTELQHC